VKRRLSPEGDVDHSVPAESRYLGHQRGELPRLHDGSLFRNVPGKDRVGTIRAGVRTPLHHLDGKECRKGAEHPWLFLQHAAYRLGVLAAGLDNSPQEEEVALRVCGKRHAQQAQVSRRKLRLDVERVDVLPDDREKGFPFRGSRVRGRHAAQAGGRLPRQDLRRQSQGIAVGERVVRPVPAVDGVHLLRDRKVQEGTICKKVEDILETFPSLLDLCRQISHGP
jgi:hypothetical protein